MMVMSLSIIGCQIMTADRPKNFTFFIRGLQMTTVVERMFHVETGAEREEWLAAIEGVKKKLDETKEVETAAMAGDEEMPDTAEETDPFETIFAKRGEVQKRSGSTKLVSLSLASLKQGSKGFSVYLGYLDDAILNLYLSTFAS